MQYVLRIGLFWALLCCITGSSYAASRDSRATLHISVTLVTTIATSTAEPDERPEVASSGNQDIIYNLHPGTEQGAEEAFISTSQAEPQAQSLTSQDDSSKEKLVVEMTTVVMK